MKPFIQIAGKRSTIESWKELLDGNGFDSIGAFAYVTDSGAAQMLTHLSGHFGNVRSCRWMVGIDYGRSHPTAIRRLAEIGGQSEIRIHDGNYVVEAIGFKPRASYHLKTAITLSPNGDPYKQIVGSGNLSASGLSAGIEAGCVINYSEVEQIHREQLVSALDELWNHSCPFEDVIEEYTRRHSIATLPTVNVVAAGESDVTELFWIDVGYVTKNRGPNSPGNQFDLPKGSHIYLGLDAIANPVPNSVLGDLEIRTPSGEVVSRRLRYGNNVMEKLTLPIPEEYGYQSYDGKILTFKVDGGEVELDALEHDDFFRIYGKNITSYMEMQSGRRYGKITLKT
jgi:HKD family nuclease